MNATQPERLWDRRVRWLIAAAAVVAYGLCVFGDFVYDDVHSVRDNPGVMSLANLPRFFTDVSLFSSLDCRLYRPVLLVSFALDAWVGGMQPWAFKATNLVLHVLAALLLHGIARRLGVTRAAAALAALLFAVHPMASEAVNTVSGRSNLLMVVALLAGMRCHLLAMAGRHWAILLTAGCTVVAVGCKEPGMILPVLLAILEGLRVLRDPTAPRDLAGAARRVLPSVAIVVGYVFLRAHFLGAASFGVGQWAGSDVSSGNTRGLETQLATMAVLLPQTLVQVLVPHGISMDPAVPFNADLLAPPVLICLALLGALTGLGLWAPRRRPALFLGTCLAWGCALPWVVKPLNLPFLEHRYYGVLAGLTLVVAALVKVPTWQEVRSTCRSAVVAVAVLLALMSAVRTLEFTSEERLWTVELQRNPDSRVAMAGMAVVRMGQQRYREARPYLEKLVAAYPGRRDARLNLAEAALHTGDPQAALEQSRYLVTHWQRNPFHWLLHSRALAAVGVATGRAEHFDQAVAAALHCLEIAAPKGLVYRTAASARRLQGDLPAAIELLDQSVARGLDHSSVLLDRSELLARVGRTDEARRDLLAVRRQDPFHPEVLRRLGALGQPPR